ncbi:MAG: ABC transporter permease [Bryobacteraceae bacterium]|nr:ABC transporter permease [Bryobacteraceae bacterium]
MFWNDLRWAFRGFRRAPAFAVTATLMLAVGIGANTAIFSIVNSVLLKPLPFADPERLAMVWERNFPRDRRQNVVAPANYRDWLAEQKSFAAMSLISDTRRNLVGAGDPEEVRVQGVSGSFFPMLGARPQLGRLLTADDEKPSAGAQAVVLSHSLWERKFGARPDIVGRTINLSGSAHQVVGVLPPGFQTLGTPVDVWGTLTLNPAIDYRARSGRSLRVIGKLAPGVTLERAQSEFSAMARRLEERYPDFNKGWGVNIVPLAEQFAAPVRRSLMVLLAAVGLVLLIACANIANLQLSRSAARERDMSVRAALGASRARLIAQSLTESLALSLIGGTAGIGLSFWLTALLKKFAPASVPRLEAVSVDPAALLFAMGATLLTALLFGSVPAMQSARAALADALKEGGRGSAGSARGNRLRGLFVVAEVALSLMLLVGAGLLIESFVRLERVDPGFDPEQVLTMMVARASSPNAPPDAFPAFFRDLNEKVRALPGVVSASSVTFLPFSGPGAATGFDIVGDPESQAGQRPTCDVRIAQPGYFETMRIPLKRGRLFEDADNRRDAPRKFVVNEAMARLHFRDRDPIGARLVVRMGDDVPGEIVGIVGDARYAALDGIVRPMVYYPHAHLPFPFMTLVVRTTRAPAALAPAVVGAVRSMDPTQPVSDVRTMNEWIDSSTAQPRFNTALLSVFSALALGLAVIGIYGVMSYAVTQRSHEIGVRLALGATPGEVRGMILSRGLRLAAMGVAIGLAAALAFSRILSGLLFEISPGNATTYVSVGIIWLAIAVAASWFPARRATKIDPIQALRYE